MPLPRYEIPVCGTCSVKSHFNAFVNTARLHSAELGRTPYCKRAKFWEALRVCKCESRQNGSHSARTTVHRDQIIEPHSVSPGMCSYSRRNWNRPCGETAPAPAQKTDRCP
jgi:hypothetical protein